MADGTRVESRCPLLGKGSPALKQTDLNTHTKKNVFDKKQIKKNRSRRRVPDRSVDEASIPVAASILLSFRNT